jgi:hypothetical protein
VGSSKRNKIEVKPSTLNNLVVAVEQGDYRIPQFQREYVWEKSKVVELFDSIYKEYPIGSFFLWKADRQNNNLFRHSIELNIPPIKDDDDVSFILDGQQRITSLYVTLKGMTVSNTDYSRNVSTLRRRNSHTVRLTTKGSFVSPIFGAKLRSRLAGKSKIRCAMLLIAAIVYCAHIQSPLLKFETKT